MTVQPKFLAGMWALPTGQGRRPVTRWGEHFPDCAAMWNTLCKPKQQQTFGITVCLLNLFSVTSIQPSAVCIISQTPLLIFGLVALHNTSCGTNTEGLIFLVAVKLGEAAHFSSLLTRVLSPVLALISSQNSEWFQREFIYSSTEKWDLLTHCRSSRTAAAVLLIGSCETACLPREIMDIIK